MPVAVLSPQFKVRLRSGRNELLPGHFETLTSLLERIAGSAGCLTRITAGIKAATPPPLRGMSRDAGSPADMPDANITIEDKPSVLEVAVFVRSASELVHAADLETERPKTLAPMVYSRPLWRLAAALAKMHRKPKGRTMSIASHVAQLNDRLTKVERAAEQTPAGTFMRTKDVAAAVGDASNAVMAAFKAHGFTALNNDRLREVEAMVFGYLLAGNPGVHDELAAVEGFADAMDGPAGERVRAQLIRDREVLAAARDGRWIEGHRDVANTITAWTPLSERYQAANELTVSIASTLEDILDIGEQMNNALRQPGVAAYYAHRIAQGQEHIFSVRSQGEMVACGELDAVQGRLRTIAIHGRLDRRATNEASEALEDYVSAINGGELEIAYEIGTDGFAQRSLSTAP
jgi:hypothetical protein